MSRNGYTATTEFLGVEVGDAAWGNVPEFLRYEESVTIQFSFPHSWVLQTRNLEEAASCLATSAIPYVSELLPGSPPFATQIFVTQGQSVDVSRVVTTGSLRVEARLPADAYALVFDLRNGVGVHQVEGNSVEVGPEFAFAQGPLQAVHVRTAAQFEALFLRMERQTLRCELEKLLERDVQSELVFAPAVRMTTVAGRRLRELCNGLRRPLYATDQRAVQDSPALQIMESELITLLLQAQPHNYRRFISRSCAAGAWQIGAAEEFMRASAHLPITLGDVCQAAGLNARTLQDAFRKKRDCTPMEFLRNIRMEEARKGLLQPDENTSVTGEASRWGFLHFGRFSKEYQTRFGELPSQTLRRSRKDPPL